MFRWTTTWVSMKRSLTQNSEIQLVTRATPSVGRLPSGYAGSMPLQRYCQCVRSKPSPPTDGCWFHNLLPTGAERKRPQGPTRLPFFCLYTPCKFIFKADSAIQASNWLTLSEETRGTASQWPAGSSRTKIYVLSILWLNVNYTFRSNTHCLSVSITILCFDHSPVSACLFWGAKIPLDP